MRDIVLGARRQTQFGGSDVVTVAFWLKVPTGDEIPNPNFRSVIVGSKGPDATELLALQNGQYIEIVESVVVPHSFTQAQIKGYLDAIKDGDQTGLTNAPPGGLWGWSRDEATKAWTTT